MDEKAARDTINTCLWSGLALGVIDGVVAPNSSRENAAYALRSAKITATSGNSGWAISKPRRDQ